MKKIKNIYFSEKLEERGYTGLVYEFPDGSLWKACSTDVVQALAPISSEDFKALE
jgi:hypothetical protein